jgi:hypothetical protein
VVPGVYNITAVSNGTLINVKRNVALNATATSVSLGTLLEGNANDDIRISTLDVGILSAAYLKSVGQTGYDVRADFDRSGKIDTFDVGLISANYLKRSPIEVP